VLHSKHSTHSITDSFEFISHAGLQPLFLSVVDSVGHVCSLALWKFVEISLGMVGASEAPSMDKLLVK